MIIVATLNGNGDFDTGNHRYKVSLCLSTLDWFRFSIEKSLCVSCVCCNKSWNDSQTTDIKPLLTSSKWFIGWPSLKAKLNPTHAATHTHTEHRTEHRTDGLQIDCGGRHLNNWPQHSTLLFGPLLSFDKHKYTSRLDCQSATLLATCSRFFFLFILLLFRSSL